MVKWKNETYFEMKKIRSWLNCNFFADAFIGYKKSCPIQIFQVINFDLRHTISFYASFFTSTLDCPENQKIYHQKKNDLEIKSSKDQFA